MGHLTFAQTQRAGGIRLDGPRHLTRALPGWLLLNHFAHVAQPARAN